MPNSWLYLHGPKLIPAWFLSKLDDSARIINLHQPKGSGSCFVHWQSCHGNICTCLAMNLNEFLIIHSVQVVTCQNHVLQDLGLLKKPEVLPHSISGSLKFLERKNGCVNNRAELKGHELHKPPKVCSHINIILVVGGCNSLSLALFFKG
jgi:hypothetical protein